MATSYPKRESEPIEATNLKITSRFLLIYEKKRERIVAELWEEYEQFLKVLMDDKLNLVLEEMMSNLTSKFEDLSVSKTALQLCNQRVRNQFEESTFLLSRAKQP